MSNKESLLVEETATNNLDTNAIATDKIEIEIENIHEEIKSDDTLHHDKLTSRKKDIPYKTIATIGLLSVSALAVTKAISSKHKNEEDDVPEEWQEIALKMDKAIRNSKLTYDELLAHLTATYSQNVIDYVLDVLDDVITEVATESVEQFNNIEGMITPYEAVEFLVERGYPKSIVQNALMYTDIDWYDHAFYCAGLLLEKEPLTNKNILYFKLRRKPYGFTHSETQMALEKLYN